MDAVSRAALLVGRRSPRTGCLLDVGVREHLVLGLRVLHPAARDSGHRAQLQRLVGSYARLERALLLSSLTENQYFDEVIPTR